MATTCEFPRCTHTATYCFPDEPSVARFCTAHQDEDALMIPVSKTCEFPHCQITPLYCFHWEKSVPRFCPEHKSIDMVLADGSKDHSVTDGDNVPSTAAVSTSNSVPTPDSSSNTVTRAAGPSAASLELAYKYCEIQPKFESLHSAVADATSHRNKLNSLKSQIKTEVDSIHKTSKAIANLEAQIESQDKKFINFFGKSPLGMGIIARDQKLVDKKMAELKVDEEKKAELDGQKAKHETTLAKIQAEQDRLDSLVEMRSALEDHKQELRAAVLEAEGTTELRRLQSKTQKHERMHASLTHCREDVAAAHRMFREALKKQATAARSNAVAAGANVGQAIGGGGGRGMGSSPGERMLQIKRNQATKQSIAIAKEAAEKLNKAQDRLSNDLRVNFAEEMKGVGIIDVPELWAGNFFKDFVAGQAAGNVGDAISQARAMKQIRKNMEELEKVIAECDIQEPKLRDVDTKLVGLLTGLKGEVLTEETRILLGVVAAAKLQQAKQ